MQKKEKKITESAPGHHEPQLMDGEPNKYPIMSAFCNMSADVVKVLLIIPFY